MTGLRALRRLRDAVLRRETPTVAHVTHWKAGSQWIRSVLETLAPDRVVAPGVTGEHWRAPIRRGGVYPAVFETREAFDAVPRPPDTRIFLVVRDLRDTLVSLYYSLRWSHVVDSPLVAAARTALAGRDYESGLFWVLDEQLPLSAAIQRSWLGAPVPTFRYEDLIRRDGALLEPLLVGHAGLGGTRRVRRVLEEHRFERLSGGRPRGREDVASHYRRGLPGDWKEKLPPRVRQAVRERFGDLLVATGYEKDGSW